MLVMMYTLGVVNIRVLESLKKRDSLEAGVAVSLTLTLTVTVTRSLVMLRELQPSRAWQGIQRAERGRQGQNG